MAPLASGPCSASSPRVAVARRWGDEEEAEEEEEEVKGGKKGGKGGKKGGGKKGGGGKAKKEKKASSAEDDGGEQEVPLPPGCPLSVQILWPQSAPLTAKDGGKHEAPVLALTPKTKATKTMSIPIQLDVVVYCRKEATLSSGLTLLRDALGAQLQRLAAAQPPPRRL